MAIQEGLQQGVVISSRLDNKSWAQSADRDVSCFTDSSSDRQVFTREGAAIPLPAPNRSNKVHNDHHLESAVVFINQ